MDEYTTQLEKMRQSAADTLKGCYWQAAGGFVIIVLTVFLQVPLLGLLGIIVAVVGFVRAGLAKRRIEDITAQRLAHKAAG